MPEFSLSEDLSSLSVEDIQELISAAREEFHSLNDSDSLEDSTLDRMTQLADSIDQLHDEFISKVELAVSKRDAISAKVFSLSTKTVTFNLDNLNSASDHVEQAIDALDQDVPDISSALSDARSAESILKKSVKGPYTRRVGPRTTPVGVYKADTEEFNMKFTTSALDDVSDAITALENGNVDSALDNLNDAADELDNSIDSYDDDSHDSVVVAPIPVTDPPPGTMASETDELTADTEEFASCSSARKRVRASRRSLRKSLTALRNCSGTRIVYVNPPPSETPPPSPPPPPPAMSADKTEFAGLSASPPYKVRAQFGKFCVAGDNGKGAVLKGACYATKAEAQAKIDSLSSDSSDSSDSDDSSSSSSYSGSTATFVTKDEADGKYPASDFAYTPDKTAPSTWKLRLTSTPGGDPDPRIVASAVATLGKGFRGSTVSLSATDRPEVIAKVRAAWLHANSDKTEADLPSILK